jgi:hypothetical protein
LQPIQFANFHSLGFNLVQQRDGSIFVRQDAVHDCPPNARGFIGKSSQQLLPHVWRTDSRERPDRSGS